MAPKAREIVVTLLVVGSILLDLHYGPYSRLWWQKNSDNKENEISNYFPIRIGQTTKAVLNEMDFYTTILLGNSENSFAPGFICTSGVFSSSVETNSPNEVWEISKFIKQYKGIQLFGLENSFTRKFIQENSKPTCSPDNWHNFPLLKSVFDYNLKRRTLANVKWYQFFESWAKSENPIIEFTSSLEKLYPSEYEFSDRELRAWKTTLRAAGCHNITPWSSHESEVW
ncbi:unnamed protein product [Rhizophagus irregularis]|nr:unnamed protein product [Rhizophagus irregularis]CAB5193983.1 unnamed protein product [Rhizophagus irregularis]